MKRILFIAENSILNQSISYNNDINLLITLLQYKGVEVYLTNPEEIKNSLKNNFIQSKLITIKDLKLILDLKKISYLKSALFMLFCLAIPKEFKQGNKIPLNAIKEQNINLEKSDISIIIDRSEPISRNNQYYDAAINLYNINQKYFDDPKFRQNENDKEIILKIDQELTNIGKNNIGLKTKILDFSNENKKLSDNNRHIFYQSLQNLEKKDNSLEKINNIIINQFDNLKNIEKRAIFDLIFKIYNYQIEFDYFCIKPSNWYGGVAVKLIGDKKNQIIEDFSQIDLFHIISKIHKDITKDVQKNFTTPILIKKNAILNSLIIQEQVKYPNFGDLRTFISFGKIQGVILRVPAQNNNIANMASGGHAELFINFTGKNKEEIKILEKELNLINKGFLLSVTKLLMNNINQSLKTKIAKKIKESAFIGFDSLLDESDLKIKFFSCNEINLSSAMGQNQIEIANLLEILLKNQKFCYKISNIIKKITSNKYHLEKFNKITFPYVKFLIFKDIILNLEYQEKLNLIEKLHLQIVDITFEILSLSDYTINKIIND